jgi:hypothetical protein
MGEKNGRRKARLHRETIRVLATRALTPIELEQVIGGKGCYTWICPTACK